MIGRARSGRNSAPDGLKTTPRANRRCPRRPGRNDPTAAAARRMELTMKGGKTAGTPWRVCGNDRCERPVVRSLLVAAIAQQSREFRESHCSPLGECLPASAGPQPFRVRHRPIQPVPVGRIRKIVERELVPDAHAVRPVGADAKPRLLRDDRQGRVLQCRAFDANG